MTFPHRLWLAMPPVMLGLADAALTLRGQPAEYWSGDYSQVLELNPLGHWMLASHPLAFIAGIAVYSLLVIAILLYLPRRWAVLAAFALSIGHTIGGAGWLAREGLTGYGLMVLFVVVAERLVAISWKRSGMDNSNNCKREFQFPN